jgi:hypothetical protein
MHTLFHDVGPTAEIIRHQMRAEDKIVTVTRKEPRRKTYFREVSSYFAKETGKLRDMSNLTPDPLGTGIFWIKYILR